MNAPLRTTTLTPAAPNQIAQLPDHIVATAARLHVEILWNEEGYAIEFCGDVIAECLATNEVEPWLEGFDCGGGSVHANLLSELVAAEQIIQTLSAQMTDAQRLAACNSLIAVGFPVEGSARCKPRRDAIAAARKAGAA